MRTPWLTFLASLPAAALAVHVPMATGVHEASACSGATSVYARDRDAARVETPGSVATDTLVLVTERTVGTPLSTSNAPKLTARVEDASGIKVPLARNDLLQALPPLAVGAMSAVLRPALPFSPDADYFLILEGLSPSAADAPTSQTIGFHTGVGPRPLPAAPIVAETRASETRSDVPARDPFCCVMYGLGSCTKSECVPRRYLSREVRTLGWPAAEGVERWAIEVESTRPADEADWQTVGSKRARETTTPRIAIFLAAGENACVRVFAIDALTGDRSTGEPVCFTAGAELPAPLDPCPGLASFSGRDDIYPVSKKACVEGAVKACEAWKAAVSQGAAGAGAGGEAGSGGSGAAAAQAGYGGVVPGAGGHLAGTAGGQATPPPASASGGCSLGVGNGSLRGGLLLALAACGTLLRRARRIRKVALPPRARVSPPLLLVAQSEPSRLVRAPGDR